jgi:hypothetical protein
MSVFCGNETIDIESTITTTNNPAIIIGGTTLEEYATRLQEVLYYWNYPWEIPKKKEKFKRKVQRIKRR